MITRRVFDTVGKRYWVRSNFILHPSIPSQTFLQDSNDTGELLWVVLNYATCVPVLLIVGAFRYLFFFPFLVGTLTTGQSVPLPLYPREHHHHRGVGEGQSRNSYSAGQDSRSQVPLCSYLS